MNKQVNMSLDKLYDLIDRPVITEKSTAAGALNKYTFIVAADATKPMIKQAIENIFKVSVTGVNTLNMLGKTKRFKGRTGFRSDRKKAIVTLKQGQTIDISAGL